jgi:hypothetical protein
MKGNCRTINLTGLSKQEIDALRADAFALVDFPELLDEPKWRRSALLLCQAFVALHPQSPLDPRGIARLVDESVAYRLQQGVALAVAVPAARAFYADLLGKSHATIKAAHLRHGATKIRKL